MTSQIQNRNEIVMSDLNDYETLYKVDLNFDADVSKLSPQVMTDYIVRVLNYGGAEFLKERKSFFAGWVQFQMDLSSLPQGVYLLQVPNGQFVKTFKTIKK